MRVVRWAVAVLVAGLVAGFVAGFVGALISPRRRSDPRLPEPVVR